MVLRLLPGMSKYYMTYKDKNGSNWSVEKGDWIGSFDKGFNTFYSPVTYCYFKFNSVELEMNIPLLKTSLINKMRESQWK